MIPPLINPLTKKKDDDFVPLGLLTLAAIVGKNNELSLYKPRHYLLQHHDYVTVAQDILTYKSDIIGFSTWCISYPAILLITKALKKLDPNATILLGGPQASITAYKTLEYFPEIDFILSGEADLSFPLFLKVLQNKSPDFEQIPGLSYRNTDGEIQQNPPAPPIQDLDDLPIPAYDLFPIKKSVKLDVGRGCPFKCNYCTTNDFFSKKYRTKSVDRIVNEMRNISERLKINNFGFAHDMLTLNQKFVSDLCNKLIVLRQNHDLKFTWTCSARTDCVTVELLRKMKSAGCESVFFGIESGSPEIQLRIGKNLQVSYSYELADTCRAIGLNMFASFILGFPEETETDVDQTLHTVLRLAMKGAMVQSSELSILPGTPLYTTHKKDLVFDGSVSNFSHAVCGVEELNLIHQYPEIFSSFYFLPVKTMDRDAMVHLRMLLNKISLFRNTLFLLSEQIKKDLKSGNLFRAFQAYYISTQSKNELNVPVVNQLVKILSAYIEKKRPEIKVVYLQDIFNFEAHVALLLTLYTGWRFENIKPPVRKIKKDFTIKPTPVWRVLRTSYILEKTIPSINHWENNKSRFRKGSYYYLVVAVSVIKCKKIKLNAKEVFLFENLSELFVKDYVKRIKTVFSEREAILWLKKMEQLGVIEIMGK